MNRRDFLTLMSLSAVLAATNSNSNTSANAAAKTQKTLVVVELAGGNDGLNTFIPYRDPNYLRLRPTLGINDGIPVSSTVALNPALMPFKSILEAGRLAVIQNVSYPEPNLSHFRSKDIWQSAHPRGSTDSGWLARYLESAQAKTADAVFLGEEYPLALTSEKGDHFLQLSPGLAVKNKSKLGQAIQALYHTVQANPMAEEIRRTVLENEEAIQKLSQDLNQRIASNGYAQTAIGRQFALLSKLIESSPQVLYMTIGGWDTHTQQRQNQGRLLGQLSLGIAALDQDLRSRGLAKNVLIMVQSEFGRRPAENGTGGTDHGTAAPVILVGDVRAGFYGGDPALDSLVNANLPVQVDFRAIYAEILSKWYGANPEPILGGKFAGVNFLT